MRFHFQSKYIKTHYIHLSFDLVFILKLIFFIKFWLSKVDLHFGTAEYIKFLIASFFIYKFNPKYGTRARKVYHLVIITEKENLMYVYFGPLIQINTFGPKTPGGGGNLSLAV